jgi:hypothetical protein
MRRTFPVAFVAIVSLLASVSFAAEQVANPAYAHWSSFKVGSSVTLNGEMKMNNPAAANMPPATMTMTRKLVELTPEKAVVEVTVSMKAMGRDMNQPAKRMDIPAKVDADKVDETGMFSDPEMKDAKTDVKKGEEEIDVLGKKLKCKWVECTVTKGKMTMHVKAWASDEIPGGLVQSESKAENFSNLMTLTAYEVGK